MDTSAKIWKNLEYQLETIWLIHLFDTEETPALSSGVVKGAKRLLRWLQKHEFSPPTIITGTVDATIVFEWHQQPGGGPKSFRSLEVLSEDRVEEFVLDSEGKSTLSSFNF